MANRFEYYLTTAPHGISSRLRLLVCRALGMRLGQGNRIEGGGRIRRFSQIELGSMNALAQGAWLWPADEEYSGTRIRIGSWNYFNRNLMLDACGLIEIGDRNMFGPDVYITDSNHGYGPGMAPAECPMERGVVRIGSRCWVGAKVVILSGVELGDGCVVGAGAVVTRDVEPGAVVAGVPARAIARYG